jgi:nicotinate-nucleotide adenylyltransferase
MKVGLFFGSFNPIHIGHMAIAQYMLEHTALEKIWFVVSPQNPFKTKETLLDQQHRLTIVRIAVEDDPRMQASNIEFNLPIPSYTVDTLTYLREARPNEEFALIMGQDNLVHFHKWKNHESILENHNIYVYPRPGCKPCDMERHEKVQLTKAPLMDISAEFIRRSIREKKEVSYFLPQKINDYIDEMNFYKK